MEKQQADQMITEYFQKLYGFAAKKCYTYQETEELCSQIVLEVYLALRRAEELYNVEGYIWRISQNTYARYVSVKKRQEGISLDGIQPENMMRDMAHFSCSDVYDFEDDTQEEIRTLNREIAFLTEKRRLIVYQFYYLNMSVQAIASKMKLPEGTVKWHLNKARNELKEGLSMERKIGKLGLAPITAMSMGHSGDPGSNHATDDYLEDKINLNIVYSVYHTPRTTEEMAEELGITPVYLEDKIHFLEDNGFLVRTAGNRYTTYVKFSPEEYSLEAAEARLKLQLQIARELAEDYVPLVREAVRDVKDVYIPGGNRQLLEAAAVYYGIVNKCCLWTNRDLSKYYIKTTAGGNFIAMVELEQRQSDPDYIPTLKLPPYWSVGSMNRSSFKYPSVYAWATDTRYCSRKGGWANNLYTDYEAVYEFINGTITDSEACSDKIARLKKRGFLTEDNQIGIMVVKGDAEHLYDDEAFFKRLPALNDSYKRKYADIALEYALNDAKRYPPQMQDLVVSWGVSGLIDNTCALMVMDILYQNGTFQPLTEKERVASTLIMFSDTLPA